MRTGKIDLPRLAETLGSPGFRRPRDRECSAAAPSCSSAGSGAGTAGWWGRTRPQPGPRFRRLSRPEWWARLESPPRPPRGSESHERARRRRSREWRWKRCLRGLPRWRRKRAGWRPRARGPPWGFRRRRWPVTIETVDGLDFFI